MDSGRHVNLIIKDKGTFEVQGNCWFTGSDRLIAQEAYFFFLLNSQLASVFQPTWQWKCDSILARGM